MTTESCCRNNSRANSASGVLLRVAGWIGPGTLLILMPKCPACFAAYFTLATGFGISLTAAAYLRSYLLVLCSSLLAFAALRLVVRAIGRQARMTD
jgi:hypothetical protein